MNARFCGKCNIVTNDLQCAHCGMQTQPMTLTPPWVEDYEVDNCEFDTSEYERKVNNLESMPEY